jgi:hypothetical protein
MTEAISITALIQGYTGFIHSLGPRLAGIERSLKVTNHELRTMRWLAGFDKTDLDWIRLNESLTAMNIPASVIESVSLHWGNANFCYLAIDLGERSEIKLYLEFPVLLSVEQEGRAVDGPPDLWCRGFKWGEDGVLGRETRYELMPGATVDQLMIEVPQFASTPAFQMILPWLGSLLRNRRDIPILRVLNQANGLGFDFRIYDLDLKVSDLARLLQSQQAGSFCLEQRPDLRHFLEAVGACALGHLSLGWGIEGEPYMNLYWAEELPLAVPL